jgi:hypothetical protein
MLPGAPQLTSATEPFARNGLSLARNSRRVSRLPFRGRSSRPATSLARLRFCWPVRLFGSTTMERFAPLPAASLPRTRCPRSRRLVRPLSPSPLPFGVFVPSGSKAFNGCRCLPVHLPNSPDLRSLPAARLFLDTGYRSSSAVRYVSGGLLFLKPLGTSYTMRPPSFAVNRFSKYFDYISTGFLIIRFKQLAARGRESLVDKTRRDNSVTCRRA